MTFSPEQVKNVDNKQPTEKEDIRFSMEVPVEETKVEDQNKKSNHDIIFKLTGEKISEKGAAVLDRLEQGKDVSLDMIKEIPEVKKAYERIGNVEPTINKPGREKLRKGILEKLQKQGSWSVDENGKGAYNGDVRRDGRIDIVIGLPASGKSSVLVNPLSEKYKSRVIDSDMAKELIPEFDNGWGAGAVHKESKKINSALVENTIKKGENIVLPVVGADYVKLNKKIKRYKGLGLKVYVHLNELPMNKSLGRMIRRFYTDGRFLEPMLAFEYQNKPTEVYEKIKKEGSADGYSRYSNDVKYGQPARYIEGENLFTNNDGNMEGRRSYGRAIGRGNVEEIIQGEGNTGIRNSLSNIQPTKDLTQENKHLQEMVKPSIS